MKLYNIVKVYTSTTGTGTVTLGSALPSFITFATAAVINGSTVSYAIEDGSNREVGTGVYTSGAETLTRNVVTSTNANNLITLSGNAVVFTTGLAADLSSDTAATANTLVIRDGSGNFALGTPTSGTLTNATGLPISTGVSGLGTGVATFLATPSSANLASAVTDETGSGALVFATSPTLATPLLGTPTSGTLTNCTGLPVSTGVSGLATGVATFLATPSSANLAAALTDETGTGANVFATSPTLVTPLLGTPTSGTLTSCTGLPISTGVSGLGASVATFLATPSSANLAAAVTDETGTGSLVFATSPTIATPTVTTSAVIPLVNGGTAVSSTLTLQSTSGAGTSDAIIFKAGSQSEKMRIDTLGRVLIGAASPSNANSKFSVTTAATTPTQLEILQVGNALALLGNKAADTNFYITNDYDSTGLGVANRSITLTKTGEVGIGTTSPGGKLDVVGGRSFFAAASEPFGVGARFISTGGAVYFGATNGTGTPDAQISAAGGGALMTLLNGGNVGIGAASPGYKLEVNGSVGVGNATDNATRSITFNTSSGGSSQIQSITLGATNQALAFRTTFAVEGESMRILGNGNVGIGTASPSYKLDVGGFAAAAQTIRVASTGAISSVRLMEADDSYGFSLQNINGSRFGIFRHNASQAGAEVLSIDRGTGNVGIGTTSPRTTLSVLQSGTANTTADTLGPAVFTGPTAGNYVAMLVVESNDAMAANIGGSIGFYGRNTTASTAGSYFSSIHGRKENGTSADQAGYIAFKVRTTGNLDNEVVRIASTGNVGIGTASPSALFHAQGTNGTYMKFDPYINNISWLGNTNYVTSIDVSRNTIFSNNLSTTQSKLNLFGEADYGLLSVLRGGGIVLNGLTNSNDGSIRFYSSATQVGVERMVILNNGNVGIGTASPGSTLPSGMTAGAKILEIKSDAAGQDIGLLLRRSDGVTGLDIWHDSSGDVGYDTRFVNIFSGSAFAFYNGTTEQLRITSGGNVGIGTASPAASAKLDIGGTTGALLVPRLTTTERNALTAVNGMIIYNTTDNQMQGRINGAWAAM